MTEPCRDEPDEEEVDLELTFARMYWRHRLRTNDATLKNAVREVGPLLPDVKAYVATHPPLPARRPVSQPKPISRHEKDFPSQSRRSLAVQRLNRRHHERKQ